MKRLLGVMAGVVLVGVAAARADGTAAPAAPAGTEVKAVKMQTKCPVMKNNDIDKKQYVDYDGKRIYVCCGGCIATIKKDPAKIVKEMEAEGITLEKVPVAKPAVPKDT